MVKVLRFKNMYKIKSCLYLYGTVLIMDSLNKIYGNVTKNILVFIRYFHSIR